MYAAFFCKYVHIIWVIIKYFIKRIEIEEKYNANISIVTILSDKKKKVSLFLLILFHLFVFVVIRFIDAVEVDSEHHRRGSVRCKSDSEHSP